LWGGKITKPHGHPKTRKNKHKRKKWKKQKKNKAERQGKKFLFFFRKGGYKH
jgi:hypothetical protein